MPAAEARSFGVMLLGLPRANLFFKREVCGARDAFLGRFAHNANMEIEKNGGPNYLHAWRKANKMTLEALADAVGTTKAVIYLLETGERPLSAKWLRRLAPVLKTTPGRLLDQHPDDVPPNVDDIWTHIADRDKPRALRVLESFRSGTDD